ncbi:MAG: hypothetical protein P8Z49_10275, partial [Acidobacteriota bacterium]
MRAIRWILGFLAVMIEFFVFDLIFYNYVFNRMLLSQGGLVKPPDMLRQYLPIMFLAEFLFSLFFTYYFFKVYKNAKLLPIRGFLFGLWIGILTFGVRFIWEFYLLTLSKNLLLSIFILGWIECIIAGISLGIIGWLIPALFRGLSPQPAQAPGAASATPAAVSGGSAQPVNRFS